MGTWVDNAILFVHLKTNLNNKNKTRLVDSKRLDSGWLAECVRRYD